MRLPYFDRRSSHPSWIVGVASRIRLAVPDGGADRTRVPRPTGSSVPGDARLGAMTDPAAGPRSVAHGHTGRGHVLRPCAPLGLLGDDQGLPARVRALPGFRSSATRRRTSSPPPRARPSSTSSHGAGRPAPVLILTGGDCLQRPDLDVLTAYAQSVGRARRHLALGLSKPERRHALDAVRQRGADRVAQPGRRRRRDPRAGPADPGSLRRDDPRDRSAPGRTAWQCRSIRLSWRRTSGSWRTWRHCWSATE